jgi:hypothetical protein
MELHVQFYFIINLRGKNTFLKIKSLDNSQNKNLHSSLKWERYKTQKIIRTKTMQHLKK